MGYFVLCPQNKEDMLMRAVLLGLWLNHNVFYGRSDNGSCKKLPAKTDNCY